MFNPCISVILFISTVVFTICLGCILQKLGIGKWRTIITVTLISLGGVIVSCVMLNNYQSDVLNKLDKSIELFLVSADISDFEIYATKNTKQISCILLETNENFPNFYFQLGNRYCFIKTYKDAIKNYILAIDDYNQLTDKQVRGLINKQIGKEDQNYGKIKKIIDTQFNRDSLADLTDEQLRKIIEKRYIWEIYCNLAIAYHADDNLIKAKEYAKKCLEINPNVDAAKKILELEIE